MIIKVVSLFFSFIVVVIHWINISIFFFPFFIKLMLNIFLEPHVVWKFKIIFSQLL